MRIDLKKKMVLMNIGIIIPILFILGVSMIAALDSYNLTTIKNYLLKHSYSTQIYLMQYFSAQDEQIDLERFMREDASLYASYIHNQVDCRVQIFYDEVLYGDSDSYNTFSTMRPEIKQAFFNKKSYIYKEIEGRRHFFMGIPIIYQDKVICVVGYIYDMEKEDQMKVKMTTIIIILGLMSIIIIIAMNSYFSHRMVIPIRKLKDNMKQFAYEEKEITIDIRTGDEIEELGDSFQQMADTILKNIHQLREEKDKQKRFFDNVTHEFSTPLTAILGYADILKREQLPEAIHKKSVGYIESEGQRLLKLVEEFLELSRLKRYDFSISKQEINCKTLIEECIEIMRIKAKRHGIKIKSESDDTNIWVDVDRFKEVLLNLIDNAIKYSHCSNIYIKAYKRGEKMVYLVEDDGDGIDSNEIEEIWEPFYRIEKNRASKGTGLGLAISKEIIQRHDGEINIKSKVGMGTIIQITI